MWRGCVSICSKVDMSTNNTLDLDRIRIVGTRGMVDHKGMIDQSIYLFYPRP